MPVYKDSNNGTWIARFYYTNWKGERKQKTKRGFNRQADAKAYEREFLAEAESGSGKCELLFSTLCKEYLRDSATRLKLSTMKNKENIIKEKLLPYLGNLKVKDITPKTVRTWQNTIINDFNYSPTYLKSIHNQLSAILNYAVKFYNLASNPCAVTGSIGKKQSEAMKIWTREQYESVIKLIKDPTYHIAFEILFWTGIREGELLALTPADILPDKKIRIDKTYSRIDREDIVTEPKTSKSNRIISIPDWLYNKTQDYISRLYKIKSNERIFFFTKSALSSRLNRAADKAGIERIRIHDLRHSHASMLIDMGYSVFAVAERLGHEKVSTTMNTYGHLYPQRRDDLVVDLENLRKNDDIT